MFYLIAFCIIMTAVNGMFAILLFHHGSPYGWISVLAGAIWMVLGLVWFAEAKRKN